MTLIPAYGRDYKSAKEVKADWEAGKDFVIADFTNRWSGSLANKEDLKQETQIYIRYRSLTRIVRVS